MPALPAYADTLQSALDQTLSALGVPGAVVGVARDDSQLVVASGLANVATGVDATPDTVFQVGSISKLYTSTLVMQLVQSGLIELDEPVRGALQEFRVQDEGATLTITPRHLLSHTSGIEGDHFVDCGRNADALWRYVSTLEEVGQIHPPDDMYSYCNAGFGVLGRLVEEQTGDYFPRALYKRLLRPLGLDRTFTSSEQAIVHRVACGHVHSVDTEPTVMPWSMMGAFNVPLGGVLATAADVLGFAGLVLRHGKGPEGKQLVATKSITTMLESQTDMPSGDERSLGWIRYGWADTLVLGHDGDTVGQKAFLRVLPDHAGAVVLLTNSPLGGRVFDDVVPAVMADLFGVEVPETPGAADVGATFDGPDEDACTGIYERLHQRLAIAGGSDGSLRMTIIPDGQFTAAGMTEHTLRLDRVDDVEWRTENPGTGRPEIVTMIGDDARPDYVHYGGRAHRRIG